MEIKGIDVSSIQGVINWKKVAASGVRCAVLRVHQKNGTDSMFEKNYKGCRDNGIRIGVYKYSYARDIAAAKQEAEDVLSVLKGRELDYPVFYDLEWSEQRALGKGTVTKIAKAFLNRIGAAGYKVGIYCNTDWYNWLDKGELRYDYWLAAYAYNDTGTIVERLRPSSGVGWQYSSKGKVPGITGNVDLDVFYTDYKTASTAAVTAEDVIRIMDGWVGFSRAKGTHKPIIDLYNSHKPLARGYKVSYKDAYCDVAVSAAFIKAGAVDLIGGTECGVEEHIQLFKRAGIWNENGTVVPKVGYIVAYNWNDNTQPNDGYADHIGIVREIYKKNGRWYFTAVEGNLNGNVGYRTDIPAGWGYIRGYAVPKYASGTASGAVPGSKPTEEPRPTALNESPKYTLTCTASSLYVRTWAGKKYPKLKSVPFLKNGSLVDYCDEVKAEDGTPWYFIRIKYGNDHVRGFASSKYLAAVQPGG